MKKSRTTQKKSSKKKAPSNCAKTFCRKYKLLTRRNFTRANVSAKDRKKMEKENEEGCRLNYCNPGCKKSYWNDVYKKDLKDSFHKNVDSNTLKNLGALSACVPLPAPFIKGTDAEKKKGWKILEEFP